MANLIETPQWEAGIYRIETNDPVIGGENGISNVAAKQLGNRTAWLKAQVEALLADIAAIEGAYAPLASPAFTGTPTAPTPPESDSSGRVATTLFVQEAVAAAGGGTYETAVWTDRAALLDPACYRIYNSTDDGAGWSVTVPAGETWYLLNAWHVQVTGSTDYDFLRVCDVNRVVPLPAGTTILASASQYGYAYVAKPALVSGGARYGAPKDLYFERIWRLRTLAQYRLSIAAAAGTAMGTNLTAAFPTDFTKGLIVSQSVHDMSWVALSSSSVGGLNLQNEISDDHEIRFAEAVMVPFMRTVFPNIKSRVANVDGSLTSSSIAGYAAVRYVKLPSDW